MNRAAWNQGFKHGARNQRPVPYSAEKRKTTIEPENKELARVFDWYDYISGYSGGVHRTNNVHQQQQCGDWLI